MKSKAVAFVNEKGGVGKTSLSVQVALELAAQGSKVLFVDLDYSSDATNYFCVRIQNLFSEVAEKNDPLGEADVYRLFHDNEEFEPISVEKNLDLLGSTNALMKIQKEDIESAYNFRDSIDELKPDYDYIIIDCPPSLGLLITSALMVVDEGGVIVPSNAERLSHEAALRIIERVEKIAIQSRSNISVLGIVHNKIKNPPTLGMLNFVNLMKETHPDLVMNTSINLSNRLIDAITLGESVEKFAKSKADKVAASQIKELTNELVERLAETCS